MIPDYIHFLLLKICIKTQNIFVPVILILLFKFEETLENISNELIIKVLCILCNILH